MVRGVNNLLLDKQDAAHYVGTKKLKLDDGKKFQFKKGNRDRRKINIKKVWKQVRDRV